jgi:hypothetical protein
MLYKPEMTDKQIYAVQNHAAEYARIEDQEVRNAIYYGGDMDTCESWKVTETEHTMRLDTSMDNFDMAAFLTYLGVKASAILDQHWD